MTYSEIEAFCQLWRRVPYKSRIIIYSQPAIPSYSVAESERVELIIRKKGCVKRTNGSRQKLCRAG